MKSSRLLRQALNRLWGCLRMNRRIAGPEIILGLRVR
jgi:hypothetical protein